MSGEVFGSLINKACCSCNSCFAPPRTSQYSSSSTTFSSAPSHPLPLSPLPTFTMPIFTSPTSFRLANPDMAASASLYNQGSFSPFNPSTVPHSSHPDFVHLTLLVFEAVMEVVFVSLPGYIVARQGMFDAEAQKFVANLNVMVFTPCLSMLFIIGSRGLELLTLYLVFTKLASQLTADKLVELAIIPFIFITQTFVSWACAWVCSKAFGFGKRPSNFVTAMAVSLLQIVLFSTHR